MTVTFSPGRFLQQLIDSLPEATSRETLVICADNGSVDGAPAQAAAANPHVKVLDTGGNLGYGTAVNVAAAYLAPLRESGKIDRDFFLVVNPDACCQPGSIDTLLATAQANPQAGSVGPRITEPDGTLYPSARTVPNLKNGIGHALLGRIWPGNPFSAAYRDAAQLDQRRPAGWLSGSFLLLRWDAFLAIGGFDERYFMYMEDVDLGDRLGRAGYQNIYEPEAVVVHAKGHAADKLPATMLPAHHRSAYLFQADRNPGLMRLPLRVALKVGLRIRQEIEVALAQRNQSHR